MGRHIHPASSDHLPHGGFMFGTLIGCYLHIVISTKNRQPVLTPEMQNRLRPYIGATAKEHGMKSLEYGGWVDHGHVVLSLPATITIAKAVQVIKGNSSRWLGEHYPDWCGWQTGYAAASIGYEQLPAVLAYVQSQNTRHRQLAFSDELRAFLKHYGIEWQEEYLLG